jgi:NAD(P)-dependent dehydrogenase (short-subunit alcohol dehydrogenase family)
VNEAALTIRRGVVYAIQLFLSDRFEEMETLCASILRADPKNGDVSHLLNTYARKKTAQQLAQNPRGRLRGKVAVVTGAASGIGKAIASMFASESAYVIVFDNNAAGGKAVEEKIRAEGGAALFVHGDVTSDSDVEQLNKRVLQECGKINILVNNAGKICVGSAIDLSPEAWQSSIDLNLTATYRCCHFLGESLTRSGGGAIINMSSVQGINGHPMAAGYAAAKGGVISLTRQLARDLSPLGVRVNCISPGVILTPIFNAVGIDLSYAVQCTPSGCLGIPEDVAMAATFLASGEASFVNGANLVLDGGLSIRGT